MLIKYKTLPAIILIILLLPSLSYGREFLNTKIHLNFGGGVNFTSNEILNYERRAIPAILLANNFFPLEPIHDVTDYGLTIDLVPFEPLLLGQDSHALKFGLRGGYRFHFVSQRLGITVTDDASYSVNSDLLRFQTWSVGPVVHYSPFVKPHVDGGYASMFGISLFATYGQLVNGRYTGHPSLNDVIDKAVNTVTGNTLYTYAVTIDPTIATDLQNFYYGTLTRYYNLFPLFIRDRKVTGHVVNLGVGFTVSVFSINVGANFYYSWKIMRLDKALYAPIGGSYIQAVGRNVNLHGFSIEGFIGIPIGW